MEIKEFIEACRKNRNSVTETRINQRVSSFNFSKSTFYSGKWDDISKMSRSLFIDTLEGRVVARGYNKFFNYGENEETSEQALRHRLSFPLRVYRKENGFLGLIGWNRETDNVSFFTRSRVDEGPFAEELKRIFYSSGVDIQTVKDLTKTMDMTILVEVISPKFDPHIIEYNKDKLVLLDIVQNTLGDPIKMDYGTMKNYWAPRLHIEPKEFAGHIISFDTLLGITAAVSDEEFKDPASQTFTEGYVIEDTNGFMFKLKTKYYQKWKAYRWMSEAVMRGQIEPSNDTFLEWCKANAERLHLPGTSIIEKRHLFYQEAT